MLISSIQHFLALLEIPSQVLRYNKYIKIEYATIHFEKKPNENINLLAQLFDNGKIILWGNLKDEYE